MSSSSNLYSQGFGTTSSASFPGNAINQTRSPSSTDVKGPLGNFSIGQLWVDTSNGSAWQLVGFSSSNGVLAASWALLGGSSSDVNTLSGDTGTAVPTAGNIQIAGGSGVVTSAAGSVVTVSLAGGGQAVDSFTPNSGTSPVIPDGSGNITLQGTGSVTVVGGTNSLTPQLTGLTNHNVLVGAGTATVTKVAPSSTSGIPLVSNGSSADPSFTTAVVAGGGTGQTAFTAFAPICGGTTATGNFLSANTNFGTAGRVLTSTGAASLPTWQAVAAVITSGTFTPVLQFGGATTGITYLLQQGNYVVIGTPGTGNAMISCAFAIHLSSKGSATGVAQVAGFPFAPTGFFVQSILDLGTSINPTSGYGSVIGQLGGNTTMELLAQPLNPNTSDLQVDDGWFTNTSFFSLSITYQC